MNFNLNEYKKSKIKEVDFFLRGINFENIRNKDKKIIGNLSPSCDEFFHQTELYRKLTDDFLIKIKEYYSVLVYTDLEFASTKEAVDMSIKEFIDKVRNELNNYKFEVIEKTYKPEKETRMLSIGKRIEIRAKEHGLINTGLNFIKMKVGDNIYSVAKTPFESEIEDAILDNLNIMIVYVYVLICMIDDKKAKYNEFIDFIAANFSPRDPEYFEIRKLQSIFLNEKNYDKFVMKYAEVMQEVTNLVEERNKPKAK